MEKLPICRVCLAGNVRMYVVINKNLRELYEKLTDNPFVTEDSRPMLACYFCCTKLKKCYQFQRKCLEAEELYTQMMNDDNKLNPLLNQDHPEFCYGLIQTPMQLISIVSKCQTQIVAIKEELPAVCETQDDTIEPKEEHQSDELELENLENSFLDIEYKPAQNSESDSEDDKPLMEFKIEVEELEVSRNKRRASDAQQLELDNVDKSYPDVEDAPAVHAESDSEDAPLMEITIKAEDEQESTGAAVAKKPKIDTRRPKPRVTISDKQKINECNRKSVSKIIMKSQNHTSNQTTKFKKHLFLNLNKGIAIDKIKKYQRVSVTEKRFKCDICQRSFSKKCNLITHTRTHTGEKPFSCLICQRSFNEKHHLVRHSRTHTDEKPFNCNICQRKFNDKRNLARHINHVHTCFTQKGNFNLKNS